MWAVQQSKHKSHCFKIKKIQRQVFCIMLYRTCRYEWQFDLEHKRRSKEQEQLQCHSQWHALYHTLKIFKVSCLNLILRINPITELTIPTLSKHQYKNEIFRGIYTYFCAFTNWLFNGIFKTKR